MQILVGDPQNGGPKLQKRKNIMLFCYVVILVRVAYRCKGLVFGSRT